MKRSINRSLFFSFISILALIAVSGCVPSADNILIDPPATIQPVQNNPAPQQTSPPAYDVIQGTYGGQAAFIVTGSDVTGFSVDTSYSDYMEVDFGANGLPIVQFPIPHEAQVGDTFSISIPNAGACNIRYTRIYKDGDYWYIDGSGTIQYPIGQYYSTATCTLMIAWRKISDTVVEYGQAISVESNEVFIALGNPEVQVMNKIR